MFYRVIAQCAQALQSIEVCLDKAEQHAKLKNYDVAILMTSRLAPDQDHFISQVQFACDYVKYGAARLSGQIPPKWEDHEKTVDEVRARIKKTIAFAQSVTEQQYEGASERMVSAPDPSAATATAVTSGLISTRCCRVVVPARSAPPRSPRSRRRWRNWS